MGSEYIIYQMVRLRWENGTKENVTDGLTKKKSIHY
mgnify:CR=1 FL=1